MKRRIAKLCVLVVLLASGGAIVNIAVAWVCHSFHESFDVEQRSWFVNEGMGTPRGWNVRSYTGFGWSRVELNYARLAETGVHVLEEKLPRWVHSSDIPRIDSESVASMVAIEIAGWPFRALRMRWLSVRNFSTGQTIFEKGGVLVRATYLPVRPDGPGFAINTVFFAAVLWVLFAFPFVLRRRIRARRGLCPACAYPIGTSEVCTECGRPVLPRRGIGM